MILLFLSFALSKSERDVVIILFLSICSHEPRKLFLVINKFFSLTATQDQESCEEQSDNSFVLVAYKGEKDIMC